MKWVGNWLVVTATAALFCACPSPARTDDGGTASDAGLHDAGTPDAGIPGSLVMAQLDGGVDHFSFVSSAAVWGGDASGNLAPASILVMFSNLEQEKLCDISRTYPFGSGAVAFANATAEVGFVQLTLFPDAGTILTPGTYVAPDAGLQLLLQHFSVVEGTQHIVSGLASFDPDRPPTRVTVTTNELPTVDFGHLYVGGHFQAALDALYADGGSVHLMIDAKSCDGQQLLVPLP